MGGSWDHDEIRLNSPLHWEHYRTVATGPGGGTTGIADLMGDLQGKLQSTGNVSLPDLQAIQSQFSGQVQAGFGKIEESNEKEQRRIDELESTTIPALEGKINSLEGSLNRTRQEKGSTLTQKGSTVSRSMDHIRNNWKLGESGSIPFGMQEYAEHREALEAVEPGLPDKIIELEQTKIELEKRKRELSERKSALQKGKQTASSINTYGI